MQLLTLSNRSFSQCPLLKDNIRNERDAAAGAGRRNRNQADPACVDLIMAMGMGFTRDRVQQALLQTHNDQNNAVNLLMEWMVQDQNAIDEGNFNANIDEGISSGESDIDYIDPLEVQPSKQIEKKLAKASDQDFTETIKKSQQKGFSWIIEVLQTFQDPSLNANQQAASSSIDPLNLQEFRDFIINHMLNEKTEANIKQMYAEIDKLFKNNLDKLRSITKDFKSDWKKGRCGESQGDVEMKEVSSSQEMSKTEEEKVEQEVIISTGSKLKKTEELSKAICWVINDLAVILKLISNNKPYLKEAVTKSDVYIKILKIFSHLIKSFNKTYLKDYLSDQVNNDSYQKLLHEILYFLFTVIQLSQMQVNIYQASKLQIDSCKRKIAQYVAKVPVQKTLEQLFGLLRLYQDQQKQADSGVLKFKNSLISTSSILCLRILTGSLHLSNLDQTQIHEYSLDLFGILNSFKGAQSLSLTVQNSTLALQLEDTKLLSSQIDKLTTRILYLKFEYETKQSQLKQLQNKDESEQQVKDAHLKSKAGLNNFLKYCQELKQREPKMFQQIVTENFMISTVKKMNLPSQDQALIYIKEAKFNELRKQVQKERTQLKQLCKSFDFKNDKTNKSLISQSKKNLLSCMNESFQKSIQLIIDKVSQRSSLVLEEFSQFTQLQTQNQKLLLPLEKPTEELSITTAQNSQIEALTKLSLAYPAVTVPILQAHPQPKRSFANWYIKDYLVSSMLQRTEKKVTVPVKASVTEDDTQMQISNQQQSSITQEMKEVNYTLNAAHIDSLHKQVFQELNNLTSYNHLMTLHEQSVKHQLRTKFMIEALHILQRAMKDKTQNLTTQKCLILASLIVIESLINFQDPSLTKRPVLAQDNFINSIRVSIQRDSTPLKDQQSQLPQSLIKLIDELMGDVIDVTLDSNKHVVQCIVNVLNILAEFINRERKMEEKRAKENKSAEAKAANKGLPSALNEEEKKELPDSTEVPKDVQDNASSSQVINIAQQPGSGLPESSSSNILHHQQQLLNALRFDEDIDDDDEGMAGHNHEDEDDEMDEDDNDDDDIQGAHQDDDEGDDQDEDGDDDDEGDDMEDADGDEEDIYDEDEEIQPDAIVVGRNNAIFEDDEEDLDEDVDGLEEEEESIQIIQEHGAGGWGVVGNRQQRQNQLDIINPIDNAAAQQPDPHARWRPYQRLHDMQQDANRRVANSNWTDEEAEVQRILSHMRAHPHIQQIRGQQAAVINNNPWGIDPYILRQEAAAAGQDPLIAKPTSMIDQMYEGLKPITDKEFNDLISKQRQLLEDEINKDQAAQGIVSQHEREMVEQLERQRDRINQMHRRLEDASEFMIEIDPLGLGAGGMDIPGMPFAHRLGVDMGMFHQIGGGIANPLLDPLFMRPQANNMNHIFGGGAGAPAPHFGMVPPSERNALGGGNAMPWGNNLTENLLFANLQRTQAHALISQNDELGQNLLQTMEIQIEEEKQQPQPLQQHLGVGAEIARAAAEEGANRNVLDNLSNDQLLSEFFAPLLGNPPAQSVNNQSPQMIRRRSIGGGIQQQPQLAQQDQQQQLPVIPPFNLGDEIQNERLRLDQRARELSDSIQRQSQDIQNIISQQQIIRQGEAVQGRSPSPIMRAAQSDVQMQEVNPSSSEQQQQQIQIQNPSQEQIAIQPVQDQINQINISDDAASNVAAISGGLPADNTILSNNQDAQLEQPHHAMGDQVMVDEQQNQDGGNDMGIARHQQDQQEEQVQSNVQIAEEMKQEEVKQEEGGAGNDDMTFGYPNELLRIYGIEPMILQEIPEDLIEEFLSQFDIPREYRQQQQQQPTQQQQPVPQQQQQQQPVSQANSSQEEQKQQQQPVDQQQQQPNQAAQDQQQQQPASHQQQQNNQANSIAQELGLDPDFLANLPEDMALELIQNEQFRMRNTGQQQQQQQPPQREAEQMDVASFIATVVDPALRREIFANMDEATLATLPPNLMAEARRVHEQIRNERQRYRDNPFENLGRRARELIDQVDPRMNALGAMGRDELGGIFGRGRARAEEEKKQQQLVGGKLLEDVVIQRHQQLFEEMQNEDFTQQLVHQLTTDEKILEQLLLVLMTNQSVECAMLPCLSNIIKIHSSGVPVIRNKVLNAITFLLKSFSVNDEEALKAFYPDVAAQLKKKRASLILIGCLRLLLKQNRSLMKQILKGLFQKDEKVPPQQQNQFQMNQSSSAFQLQRQNHMLKKQTKYLKAKNVAQNTSGTEIAVQIDTTTNAAIEDQMMSTLSKASSNTVQQLPALAEIFQLIKTDLFKNDKSLLRNLSLLIHQILKQFDIALEELEYTNGTISSETVQSLAEVLSLDIIDQTLMEDLGEFLFQISKKKRQNFDLISEYCHSRALQLVNELTQKLHLIVHNFQDMKSRVSPSKMKIVDNYSPAMSQISHFGDEEEKSEMIIDTTTNVAQQSNPQGELEKADGSSTNVRGTMTIKLQDEDERALKLQLKGNENSEMLLRIIKLFNLFYEKFTQEMDDRSHQAADQEMPMGDQDSTKENFKQMIQFIQSIYSNEQMKNFVQVVSKVMKIVYITNIEAYESMSSLLFCVFGQYFPDMMLSVKDEEEQNKLQKSQPATGGAHANPQQTKYQIKMITYDESQKMQNRFIIFRNQNFFTNRVQEISQFCLTNKRLINKLIKQKPNVFNVELDGLIRYMPNLLDFDNKRVFFKKEIAKLKKNPHGYNSLQLFIRRDDIFMDAYAQIHIRTADEMKSKLHIQFTGERGQDAGGLTRDFFIELSRQMFNPMYSLFILSCNGSTYYPNPKSHIQADHLRYFKFIGRIVGKALLEECLLECYFVKSFYKIITGDPLMVSDMEDFDNELYNNLKWCITNDITTLQTTFVAEQDHFGKMQDYELIEGGSKIPVNNENKSLFIEKMVEFKLYKSIHQQVDAFLEGFYELIPKDLISIFNHKELELLISGLPNFDLSDLKQNTEFAGYNAQSPQVLWLWDILETFDNEDRAQFLQFVTGSSKVPIDGFKGLMGMRGPQKFTVAKIKTDDILRLPSGHTCFNQIDIPEYPSKEIMHERLLTAIKETRGFGFA